MRVDPQVRHQAAQKWKRNSTPRAQQVEQSKVDREKQAEKKRNGQSQRIETRTPSICPAWVVGVDSVPRVVDTISDMHTVGVCPWEKYRFRSLVLYSWECLTPRFTVRERTTICEGYCARGRDMPPRSTSCLFEGVMSHLKRLNRKQQ